MSQDRTFALRLVQSLRGLTVALRGTVRDSWLHLSFVTSICTADCEPLISTLYDYIF